MHRFLLVATSVFILGIPAVSHAAVMLSEIAWMGSSENANDEWIELYNHGDEGISVAGWTLSDGVSLEIVLEGTLPPRALALLERTDDNTVPGVTAFFVYTGALSNEGRTLTLRNANGGIEDQVAGGENWQNIGGNNETKETPQRTMTGWVTGTPTPGAVNVEHDSTTSNEANNEGTDGSTRLVSHKKSDSGNTYISLEIPDSELELTVEAPTIAYVNQPVSLSVLSDGIGKQLAQSLVYTWNFGDAETGFGKEVTHTFRYPGEYVVVVRAAFARHDALARHTITVLPVTFSITRTATGGVQIHNDAKYEVNVSGYTIQGNKDFILPENTILLPNATLTLSAKKLGTSAFPNTPIALLDQKSVLVASVGSLPTSEQIGTVAVASAKKTYNNTGTVASAPATLKTQENEKVTAASDDVLETIERIPSPADTVAAPIASELDASKNNTYLPYIGLVAIIALGLFGLLGLKRTRMI